MFVIARVSTSARTIADEFALECATCPFSAENMARIVRYTKSVLDYQDELAWWEDELRYGDW